MANGRVISAVLRLRDQNFGSGMDQASRNARDLGRKVQHTGNTVKQFSKSAVSGFATVAKGALGVAAAFAGVASLNEVGSAIVETEDAFNRLSAKTGVVGDDLQGLKGIANEVFKTGFGDSLSTVTNDLGTLKAMFKGLNDNELTNLAMGANTIGDLWGAEVTEVGTVVKNMTSNFKGLSQTDALDLITVGFQKTGDYSNDLLDTMKEYSPLFAKLGLDAKDSMGLLIKGAEAGAWNMDKVGDAVKEFGIRGMDGSKSSAEGFALVGLNAKEMTSKIAEGGDSAQSAFAATLAGLSTMKDKVKQNQAGVALFGTQWEDVREDVILSMQDSAEAVVGFEGATKKAKETMHKGFGARMTSLWRGVKSSVSSAFDSAGGQKFMDTLATQAEKVGPIFEGIISNAIGVATSIQNHWPQISSTLSTVKGYLTDVRDGATSVYDFISSNWSSLGPAVTGIAATIAAFKIGIVAVSAATGIWKGVTTATAIATGLLNGTLAISPLGWVALAIGAVVAAGVLLWQNWDTVKEKGQQLWDKVTAVGGGIKEGFSNAFSSVKSAAGDSLNFVIDKVNSVISLINKIPGVEIDSVGRVDWGGAEKTSIPQYAKGTSYAPGGLAQIHERGGEIVDLPSGSRVYPHDKSVQMARSEGKGVVIEKIIIEGTNLTTDQIASELLTKIQLRMANI
ncbi:phage tail tape measure protein [Psychrobacillus sp. FSL K6-2684]|uniref:phage tail tape measure protein n=1 Tax=Psychrobacillus sp. FSL K6-2684 TaxID=2921547 RepID=UPI0030FB6AB7